ncbi:glycosyltransferase family 2 protein [Acidithiobacillus marinus]|nr:glycosyltransferase [Acidithiobacillus marinus]
MTEGVTMQISVMIPTYRRPKDLERCLEALGEQLRPADEIIVVARREDKDTHDVLKGHAAASLPLRVVIVDLPGLVTAMNLGLEAACGDILAITDDDSAPFPDWLQRIERAFEQDESIAGVGGRDLIRQNGTLIDHSVRNVGKVLWYGKVIANHHLRLDHVQFVDLLKGVNGAYRLSLLKEIGFDRRLFGRGAQWHWELSLGLTLRQKGWRLLYDPEIRVNHYPGQLFGDRSRDVYNPEETRNRCHNEALVLLCYYGIMNRLMFLFWSTLVGTSESYGLVQMMRYLPKEKAQAVAKFRDNLYGRYMGIRSWLRH